MIRLRKRNTNTSGTHNREHQRLGAVNREARHYADTAGHRKEHCVPARPVRTPRQLIDEVNSHVIGQDHAKSVLANLFYYKKRARNHILTSPDETENESYRIPAVLIAGPTGTGKTHVVHKMCAAAGIDTPITVDASALVPAGIVGTTLSDVDRRIFDSCNQEAELAEHAVVFLDEFDKLLLPDFYHKSVLTQLLTMMEGSAPLPISSDRNDKKQYPDTLNTRHILFILGGAFGIHFEENRQGTIGFIKPAAADDVLDQQSLKTFKMPNELRGRIGQIVTLNPLSNDDLAEVCRRSTGSPLRRLQAQLRLVDCTLDVTDAAINRLIEHPLAQELGARGIFQAFNSLPILEEIALTAPEQPNQHFVIDEGDILLPAAS